MNKKNINILKKLLVRICHLALTLFVLISTLSTKTVLHLHWEASLSLFIYSICYIACILLSLLFYFITCQVDPGFVAKIDNYDSDSEFEEYALERNFKARNQPENTNIQPNSNQEYNEIKIKDFSLKEMSNEEENSCNDKSYMIESQIKLKFCGFCGIMQPLRARHCEDCMRCVRKFDHHCPWLGTCIGEFNHRYFFLFIFVTFISGLWTLLILCQSFIVCSNTLETISTNLILIIDGIIVSLSSLSLLILLSMHTYLCICNMTTWEFLANHRLSYLKNLEIGENPFHMGYFSNIKQFCCTNIIMGKQWEKVYSQFFNEK